MKILQFLPVSLNITGKKIVLIGGGSVAFHKASTLRRFTDAVKVVAPEFHSGFASLPVELAQKAYEPDDLAGAFLAYICTENEALNEAVKNDCAARGILASVCDNPSRCDFISPAIHKDENVTIAVSSSAQSVRQSINIRNQIRALIEEKTVTIR
jgi:siroheme synthase-like protein